MAQIATKEGSTATTGAKDPGYSYKINSGNDSELVVEVQVKPDFFAKYKEMEYKRLAPDVSISGFRPGKAPRNLIEARLGARLFEDTISAILPPVTAAILASEKINPLDYASYNVKKVSDADGLEFSATFTVIPEVKLPNFKKIKVKQGEAKVGKKEIDDLFSQLQKDILASRKGKDKESKSVDIDWAKELQDETLTDEKKVKAKLEESLLSRKQREVEDKYMADLVVAVIEAAKIKAPHKLVHVEMDRREKEYVGRIEKLGLKLEDFLKAQNTDMDALRKNWHSDAEFALASDILFVAIAKEHKLQVDKDEIEAEVRKVQDPKLKQEYDSEGGRNYISSVLLRQKAVQKLKDLVA